MDSDNGTIGALIDNGYTLWAHCYARDCHHSRKMDLNELAKRLGRDQGAMRCDLVPSFDARNVDRRTWKYRRRLTDK